MVHLVAVLRVWPAWTAIFGLWLVKNGESLLRLVINGYDIEYPLRECPPCLLLDNPFTGLFAEIFVRRYIIEWHLQFWIRVWIYSK